MRRLLLTLSLLLCASPALPQAVLNGGAVVNVGSATPITVSVTPPSQTVAAGSTQAFTFTLMNDTGKGATLTLTGPGCTGATCGTLSATTVHTGGSVTYTAPSTVPSPASATITATSVQDPTKFVSASITIVSAAPAAPVSINQPVRIPAKQPGASTNTFTFAATVGNGGIVAISAGEGTVISGVTANPGSIALTSIGCTGNVTGGGFTAMYYTSSPVSPGITSVTVAESTPESANMDMAYYDISNMGATPLDGSGVCNQSATATTNPVGPAVITSATGDLIVAALSTNDTATSVNTPFVFQALPRGDAVASYVNPTTGTFTPSWTTVSGAYTYAGAAFRSGTSPVVIAVGVNPSTATVQNNQTASFVASVSNDPAAGGVTWALAGSGCSGATCGGVSPSSSASGAAVTYTAPSAVPSPATVTLTATSVTDGTKSAAATITVVSTPPLGVTISPPGTSTFQAGTGGTPFTATVTNDSLNQGVTWLVTEGSPSCSISLCGSVSPTATSSGVATTYTPPASVTVTQSITIKATSVTNTGVSASATILVTPATQTQACSLPNCPAFPGAQGGGAASAGGRGGVVYNITTTADTTNSGCVPFNPDTVTCSRRDCLNASGARNCIYRVAGLFLVNSGSDIRMGNPFVTEAGQTAPGEVIVGGPTTAGALDGISTHDIITRYVTFSPDNPNVDTGPSGGTTSIWIVNCGGLAGVPNLNVGGCYNIIHDHVSTRASGNKSWITTSNFTPDCSYNGNTCPVDNTTSPPTHDTNGAGNKNGDGPNHSITQQWSLMYEPSQGHPVGYGTATDETCVGTARTGTQPWCLSIWETDIDFHHNLLVNISHRIPENSNYSTRWVNNIVYNWADYASQMLGATFDDFINNKYITGNLNSGAFQYPIHLTSISQEMSGAPSVYVAGNILGAPGANTPASNQYGTLTQNVNGEDPGNEIGPIPTSWQRSSPMPASNNWPINAVSASVLDSTLEPTVGNSQHLNCSWQNGIWASHRDAQDSRIVAEYQNGSSGGFWPNGVTYTGVFYLFSSAAPGLPTTCPPGDTCLPFPPVQQNWTDIPVTSGFTKCTESLHDGISDSWKSEYGLSLTDTNLYKEIDPVTGVTYLEDYINGIVP